MKIFSLIFLFIACLANANQQPIRIVGAGPTYNDALQNAFKVAIEYKVGLVLLNETESKNQNLVRDEIISYSSGYVDNFRVLSNEFKNNLVLLTVDVFVSDSKLANRLLSKPSSTNVFEGLRHSTQIESYMEEREKGDKLLVTVLNDYPYRAYNIEQKPYQIYVDEQRNVLIKIPYRLTWNNNYLVALREAMGILQDIGPWVTGKHGLVHFMINGQFRQQVVSYRFSDIIRVEGMKRYLTGINELRLKLIIKNNNGDTLFDKCYYPTFLSGRNSGFYRIGHPHNLYILEGIEENNFVSIRLQNSKDTLSIGELELRIAKDKDCTNR